ncbi:MAG: glycosyltransferase [Flavobacterium sp.]|nr:glycosyltransferase [Flavobacterium sp.]
MEEKNKVAKKHRLPKEYLLNVGTVEERKNVLAVVKAIRNIDTHLVIVGGSTPYTTEVLNYIAENKMESKVLFIKNLNSKELAIIYQLATLFVYTSIFEGFGIPIIVALYSKTPVIATKNGVFPEAGGPDSIYIDSNNIEEIEGKIIYLLSNPILRLEIAAQGHQFVQKFNDQNIATEVMKVYKTILNF